MPQLLRRRLQLALAPEPHVHVGYLPLQRAQRGGELLGARAQRTGARIGGAHLGVGDLALVPGAGQPLEVGFDKQLLVRVAAQRLLQLGHALIAAVCPRGRVHVGKARALQRLAQLFAAACALALQLLQPRRLVGGALLRLLDPPARVPERVVHLGHGVLYVLKAAAALVQLGADVRVHGQLQPLELACPAAGGAAVQLELVVQRVHQVVQLEPLHLVFVELAAIGVQLRARPGQPLYGALRLVLPLKRVAVCPAER